MTSSSPIRHPCEVHMLKTLLPALAVLLAVRSGPARTPVSPQLLELESRVEELERKFQTRLERAIYAGSRRWTRSGTSTNNWRRFVEP